MSLILGVDTERLMSAYYRAQPEMTSLVGDHVYTELPTHATPPLLRLTLIGGGPVGSLPLWLDESFIQLDAYGGPKVLARQIIDTARALLWSGPFVGVHSGLGVVTGVEFTELSYIPDDGYEPARPRYIATVSVYTHPET